jgi:hypothetical protein
MGAKKKEFSPNYNNDEMMDENIKKRNIEWKWKRRLPFFFLFY